MFDLEHPTITKTERTGYPNKVHRRVEMGDTAELILEGILCQYCGGLMEDQEAPGYPRTCEDCE